MKKLLEQLKEEAKKKYLKKLKNFIALTYIDLIRVQLN